jgi:hypothetical protein
VLRCVPPPETFRPYFSDDRCTKPVSASDRPVLSLEERNVCPARVRIFARGERHVGGVYGDSGGTCVLVSAEDPSSARLEYREFAIEIAPERFPALGTISR